MVQPNRDPALESVESGTRIVGAMMLARRMAIAVMTTKSNVGERHASYVANGPATSGLAGTLRRTAVNPC